MNLNSLDGDHTPTPWKLRTSGSFGTDDTMVAMTYPLEPDEQRKARAKARRVVACVNACAGIPTEILEGIWQLAKVQSEVDSP